MIDDSDFRIFIGFRQNGGTTGNFGYNNYWELASHYAKWSPNESKNGKVMVPLRYLGTNNNINDLFEYGIDEMWCFIEFKARNKYGYESNLNSPLEYVNLYNPDITLIWEHAERKYKK